jgi:hypothetical protein
MKIYEEDTLLNELNYFISFLDRDDLDPSFEIGNVFNVIKYKTKKKDRFIIYNDHYYRRDFDYIIDNSYNHKGKLPKIEIAGYKVIDNNDLVVFYGDNFNIGINKKISDIPKKFKSIKGDDLTDYYQSFGLILEKKRNQKLIIKSSYMTKKDLETYIKNR